MRRGGDIAGRASSAARRDLLVWALEDIAGRASSAAGRDLLVWALGDESRLVDQLRAGSGLGGEPCYGRGIRERGRKKSASCTPIQICELLAI